jgi:hypothetical protein
MEKSAIKEIIYGGISELMRNRRYFYHSSIGRQYCHWTDDGKAAMQTFLNEMTTHIYDAEEKALDERAKKMVLDTLKQ